jgi:uncharacterized membrane protein YbhN (UPF0104 family)
LAAKTESAAITITSKTLFKLLIASALTLGLGYWVESTIGWHAIVNQWQTLPLSTLLLCFGLTLFSHTLRGTRLLYTYKQLPSENPWQAMPVLGISFIHNAANFILPMRLGELVLPALSRYQLSVPIKDSFRALLGIRLFDLHVLVTLLVLFQHALLGIWQIPLIIAAFLGLILLPWFGRFEFLSGFFPPQFHHYTAISITYGLSILIWGIKLFAFYTLFTAFVPLNLSDAATGILMADLSSALPINGFASAGSYEAAFAAGLLLSDSYHNALLSAIINLHIFLLFSNIVAAALGWLILVITPKSSAEKNRA